MKVLISCGGTGGHINPGLAIADIIKAKYPDAEFLFAGERRATIRRTTKETDILVEVD